MLIRDRDYVQALVEAGQARSMSRAVDQCVTLVRRLGDIGVPLDAVTAVFPGTDEQIRMLYTDTRRANPARAGQIAVALSSANKAYVAGLAKAGEVSPNATRVANEAVALARGLGEIGIGTDAVVVLHPETREMISVPISMDLVRPCEILASRVPLPSPLPPEPMHSS